MLCWGLLIVEQARYEHMSDEYENRTNRPPKKYHILKLPKLSQHPIGQNSHFGIEFIQYVSPYIIKKGINNIR